MNRETISYYTVILACQIPVVKLIPLQHRGMYDTALDKICCWHTKCHRVEQNLASLCRMIMRALAVGIASVWRRVTRESPTEARVHWQLKMDVQEEENGADPRIHSLILVIGTPS